MTQPSWEELRDTQTQQPWTVRTKKPKGWWSVTWRLAAGIFGLVFVIAACITIARGPQPATPTTAATFTPPTTASLTPMTTAPADIAEAAYLDGTADLNTKYHASESESVNLGHAICTDLQRGTTLINEAMGLTGETNALGQPLDAYDAGRYVGAAHAAFCPSA